MENVYPDQHDTNGTDTQIEFCSSYIRVSLVKHRCSPLYSIKNIEAVVTNVEAVLTNHQLSLQPHSSS